MPLTILKIVCLLGVFWLTFLIASAAFAQVLPLPGPRSPEQDQALRLFTAKSFTERLDLEWLDTFKPERDPRTEQTLDRLLFKDFLKRLPACIEAIK